MPFDESYKLHFMNKQPPPSFLATMEEYIREAPQSGTVQRRLVRKLINVVLGFVFPLDVCISFIDVHPRLLEYY